MNMAKILTSANKSAVFHAIAVEFDMSTTPYRVVCQEKKLKKSEKLVELGIIDHSLKYLTSRRRNTRFRSANKPG
jgi:hypothetical protein